MRRALAAIPLLCLVGGCFLVPDHKQDLTRKGHEIIGHIFKENYDACAKMTDPAAVKSKGDQAVRNHYKLINGLAKLFGATENDVRIDDVIADKDAKTAEMKWSRKAGDGWVSLPALHWVRVDGQWYLTLS